MTLKSSLLSNEAQVINKNWLQIRDIVIFSLFFKTGYSQYNSMFQEKV